MLVQRSRDLNFVFTKPIIRFRFLHGSRKNKKSLYVSVFGSLDACHIYRHNIVCAHDHAVTPADDCSVRESCQFHQPSAPVRSTARHRCDNPFACAYYIILIKTWNPFTSRSKDMGTNRDGAARRAARNAPKCVQIANTQS